MPVPIPYLVICSNLIQTCDYMILMRHYAECYIHIWKCKIYIIALIIPIIIYITKWIFIRENSNINFTAFFNFIFSILLSVHESDYMPYKPTM